MGVEGETVVVAEAGETHDEGGPDAGGVGDVDAVFRVAMGVVEVDEKARTEVRFGQVQASHVSGHDGLGGGGQGGVAGGERIVIVEVSTHFLFGEEVRAIDEGEDEVSLF